MSTLFRLSVSLGFEAGLLPAPQIAADAPLRGYARYCSIGVGRRESVEVTPSVLLIGVWLGAFNIIRLVHSVLVCQQFPAV